MSSHLNDRILKFVESSKPAIMGKARKFRPFSSYDPEDFEQEAYVTAFEARKSCTHDCDNCLPSACENYFRLFWGILKKNFSIMSDIPSKITVLGDGPRIPCRFDSLHDALMEPASGNRDMPPAFIPHDDEHCSKEEEIIKSALSLMTPAQRRVWEISLEKKRQQEIAERLGKSQQGISALLKRGMDRAAQKMSVEDRRSTQLIESTKGTVVRPPAGLHL